MGIKIEGRSVHVSGVTLITDKEVAIVSTEGVSDSFRTALVEFFEWLGDEYGAEEVADLPGVDVLLTEYQRVREGRSDE